MREDLSRSEPGDRPRRQSVLPLPQTIASNRTASRSLENGSRSGTVTTVRRPVDARGKTREFRRRQFIARDDLRYTLPRATSVGPSLPPRTRIAVPRRSGRGNRLPRDRFLTGPVHRRGGSMCSRGPSSRSRPEVSRGGLRRIRSGSRCRDDRREHPFGRTVSLPRTGDRRRENRVGERSVPSERARESPFSRGEQSDP